MKNLQIILALIVCSSAAHLRAQYGINGGLSMLSIPSYQPRPGAFVNFEGGSSNFKLSLGFNASLIRFNSGFDDVNATIISNNQSTVIRFEKRMGYMSVPIMFKYYMFDTEETTGSNVSFGLGVGLQLVSSRQLDDYDRSVYYVYPNSYNDYVSRNVELGFQGQVGYQYTFDSGLTLTGHIGYELSLENVLTFFDEVGNSSAPPGYYSYSGINVLTTAVGAKYIF